MHVVDWPHVTCCAHILACSCTAQSRLAVSSCAALMVLPCPAMPCPALPCPAVPCCACPALPHPALPYPALPCPALPSCSCLALQSVMLPALPCPITVCHECVLAMLKRHALLCRCVTITGLMLACLNLCCLVLSTS